MPDGRMLERPLLSGRLVASGGRLLLEIPASFVQGLFGLVRDPGVERPTGKPSIMVMTADEVKKIGGEDKITERGKTYGFTLGAVRTFSPGPHHPDASKLWAVLCMSPEIEALRAAYGLSARIHDHPFHIVFATRKRGVLQEGSEVVKSSYLRTALEKSAYIDFEEDNRKRPEGRESWIKRHRKGIGRAAGLGLAGAGIAGLYMLGKRQSPPGIASDRSIPPPKPEPHQPPAGTPRVVSEGAAPQSTARGSDFLQQALGDLTPGIYDNQIPRLPAPVHPLEGVPHVTYGSPEYQSLSEPGFLQGALSGLLPVGALNTFLTALDKTKALIARKPGTLGAIAKSFPEGIVAGAAGLPGGMAAWNAQEKYLDPLMITGASDSPETVAGKTFLSKALVNSQVGMHTSTQLASRIPGLSRIPVAGKMLAGLRVPAAIASRGPATGAGAVMLGGLQSLYAKATGTGLVDELRNLAAAENSRDRAALAARYPGLSSITTEALAKAHSAGTGKYSWIPYAFNHPRELWRAAVAAESSPRASEYYGKMERDLQARTDGNFLRRALTYDNAYSTIFDDVGTLAHQAGENHAFNAGNDMELANTQRTVDRKFFDQYARGSMPRDSVEEIRRLSPKFNTAVARGIIRPEALRTRVELGKGLKGEVDPRLPSDILRSVENGMKTSRRPGVSMFPGY